MERKPRTKYEGGDYPDIFNVPSRRELLAGLGVAAGGAAVAVTVGCAAGSLVQPDDDDAGDDDVVGDDDTAVAEYEVRLPPGADVRTVYFVDDAYIDYHVDVVMDDGALAVYLGPGPEEALLAMDELLADRIVYDFAPGRDLTEIEEQLTQALADLYYEGRDASTDAFLHLALVIDEYDEGEQIDGDMEAPVRCPAR